MLVLVFDTETTGLPQSKSHEIEALHLWPYIVQFSYILYDTETHQMIKSFDHIIKLTDGKTIPIESTNIHRITDEMSYKYGVSIESVIEEFMGDMQKANLAVAHNAQFDINMLKVEIKRMYLNEINMFKKRMYGHFNEYIEFSTKIYCTMNKTIDICKIKQISKNGKEYNKYPRLSELHQHLFKQSLTNLHNSFNDVAVCLRCYYKLVYDKDICELNDEINNIMKELIVN